MPSDSSMPADMGRPYQTLAFAIMVLKNLSEIPAQDMTFPLMI